MQAKPQTKAVLIELPGSVFAIRTDDGQMVVMTSRLAVEIASRILLAATVVPAAQARASVETPVQ